MPLAFSVIIPARFGSTRLPGKPLLEINGKPLIQHVYERAAGSRAERVVIATDHRQVASAAARFGAEVVMTSPQHRSGTDRIAEVVSQSAFSAGDIVVNVQGDEPLIPVALIDQVAEQLDLSPSCAVATLCEPITHRGELDNPNIVKVVKDHAGQALYFSRAPIPYPRVPVAGNYGLRHIGIYAYRVSFLRRLEELAKCEIEETESLEQLRFLYAGFRISVGDAVCRGGIGVDTPEDLIAVRKLLCAN